MQPHYKIPRSVLVVIHSQTRGFLMLRRKDNGLWQSVTGSRLTDESFWQTAVRELAEETGLSIAQGILTDTGIENEYEIIEPWRSRYAPGVLRNLERVFHFALAGDAEIRINPDEHTEYKWMSADRAAEAAFSETNRREIQAIAQASGRE